MMRVAYSAMSGSCVTSTMRDAALRVQPLKDTHHLDAGSRIEVAGRLVREQQLRVVHERARDCDALLLSAGQLIRVMTKAIGKAHGPQRLGGPLAARCASDVAGVEQGQLHVLERRCARQQIESLENEADLGVAHAREDALIEG